MIQHSENPFSPPRQTVIEGGSEIEQEQSNSVHAVAHDLVGIAIDSGIGHQHSAAREREARADQVTDAVKSFAFVHALLIIRIVKSVPRSVSGDRGVGDVVGIDERLEAGREGASRHGDLSGQRDAELLDTRQSRHHAPPYCMRPKLYSSAAAIAAAVRTWFHIVHRPR